jgi:FKBP-type peptidyl-prolyl cis-trans isomerase
VPTSKSRKPPKKTPALGQSTTKPWVRVVIIVVVAVVAFGSVAALVFNDSSSSDDAATTTTTPPTTAANALPSAAGKPCVALADPLPAGVTAMPIVVGPPPTGLVIKDLTVGTGAEADLTSTVTLDYLGVSCSTGKIFDTSFGKTPTTLALAQFIPGFSNGVAGMKVGGVRLIGIPAAQAYGADGSPGLIAPDEPLWFLVSLKGVTATPAPAPTPAG